VVKEFIAEAKRIGVEIAIDDFGSGYSNFEHLIHLDVNYLKIDGSLIQNLDTDENAQLIVKTIVQFAQALHIKTIAEYVSSEEIFNHVKELGIDYSQGYFIGKPEPKTL
jgi:EAL domain-containing protein (putative c-di-GMP-specific phosphodiesterase class I)